MARSSKLLKRLGIGLGLFVGLFVLAAVALPFIVDVDQFRPKIVEMAKPYLNGELKLGRLRLSLWGRLKIEVDGFSLADAQGRNVLSAKDVYFHVPFLSVLSGSPALTFALRKPEVTVIKDKNGINALTLVKTQPAAAPAAKPAGSSPLPALALNARLGIDMTEARVSYVDKITDLASTIDALTVRVKDLSLSRPTDIEVSANLDTRMGKVLEVKGPATLRARATPQFSGATFEKASVTFTANLDKVAIRYGDLFFKTPAVPLNADGALSATMTSASVEKLTARFHNAIFNISGGATGLGGDAMAVQFAAKSNAIDMAPWAQLVPMLKSYELSGLAAFSARGQGPLAKLQYGADFELRSLKAKAPMLKGQPQIDAVVKVVTDRVEHMEMTFKAPGNDLKVVGQLISFSKPKFEVKAISLGGMDLDQLVDFPPPAKTKDPGATAPAAKSTVAAKKSDFDALLDPLRESAIAAAAEGRIGFGLKFVKMRNVRIDPLEGQMTLRNLVASLEKFRMGVFDGTIAAKAGFELKPKTPRYQFEMDVAGLDLKKAVTSQYEMFKNTAYGKAYFRMKGTGASFNPDPAKVNLKAAGNFSLNDGQFATLDIGKMASDAVNKALAGLDQKIPQLAGKRLSLGNVTTGYDKFTADFTIADGVFSMPNFQAISGSHKGIDLQGATRINLVDYGLKADWFLIDTHNLTGARNLSVNIAGVQVDALLAEPNQPVRFPIQVGGTLFAPAPSYTAVPEAIAKTALANTARAAESRVKAEATNRAKAELKKVAPPALQNVINKFKF